jgi:hypothetical protein
MARAKKAIGADVDTLANYNPTFAATLVDNPKHDTTVESCTGPQHNPLIRTRTATQVYRRIDQSAGFAQCGEPPPLAQAGNRIGARRA